MSSRVVRLLAGATLCAILAAGCGGGDGPSLAGKAESSGAGTTTPLPAWASLFAEPVGTEIAVHEQPDASSPSKSYPNPWQLDENPDHVIPQVFLVESEQKDWVEVLLPVRHNGTTGWVRKQDVQLTPNQFSIDISLADRQITVHDADEVLIQEPVAIGTSENPTPPGKYYLRVLLKAPDPNTVYGPYAFGLSAHSDVLTTFNGGDGEIGIHGNNDASVLGKDVTHGC
ncbi:MAG: L,D-transpeptidase family protein, partial [Acidimicrobiia bacterium]|nr:L,D-transpeptidase family protein [Acidimicrobiia bacterium]